MTHSISLIDSPLDSDDHHRALQVTASTQGPNTHHMNLARNSLYIFVCLTLVFLTIGCSTRFAIVEPKADAQTLLPGGEARFSKDGVDYVLRQVDTGLVLRVVNVSDKSVEILAGSRVTTPTGAAVLIPPITIASRDAFKIELPPSTEQDRTRRVAQSLSETRVGSNDEPVYRTGLAQQPFINQTGVRSVQTWSFASGKSVRVDLRLNIAGEERSHLFVFKRV